jgi:hypothetical protein
MGNTPIRQFRRVALFSLLTAALYSANTPTTPSKYVTAGSLPAGWQIPMITHGDRMQVSGKERLTLSGTTTRNGSATAAFQLINELPNSVRYQELSGPHAVTLVFGGAQLMSSLGAMQSTDTDLIETLAYDTPTWFFYAPSNRLAVRKLGTRFRTDGGTGKTYTGPVYDVYLVLTSVQQVGAAKQQPKYYHVNSDTHLVEQVFYQDATSPSTKVQIIFGNWTTVSNNRIPQLIRRLENNVEVLRLTVSSATIGPSVADGAFLQP